MDHRARRVYCRRYPTLVGRLQPGRLCRSSLCSRDFPMTPLQSAAQAPAPREEAVVGGGGIVGVCCALYLQREGYAVTLIDPAPAGDSTAKWSCGQMAVSEVIPLSKPGILKKIPGWLL